MQSANSEKFLLKNFIHDIVSPITMIRLNLDLLYTRLCASSNYKEMNLLQRTISGLEQLYAIIIATKDEINLQEKEQQFSVVQELRRMVELIQPKLNQLNIELKLDLGYDWEVYGK